MRKQKKQIRKKVINLFLMVILIIISFFVGINFYKNEDVDHDGDVDIRDLLIVKKYILEKGDK